MPRILSILSPAHHLASAMALDNLFGVEPPPLAQDLRNALNLALIFRHHLKKLFFLLSSFASPIAPPPGPRGRNENSIVPHHMFDEIMQASALAQEAASILGGRCDHPLTAVAGGVSRFLKESHCRRLTEIAQSCLKYVIRLREFLHNKIIGPGNPLDKLMVPPVCPMTSVALDGKEGAVVLTGDSGAETARFTPDKTFDRLEAHCEPWTYLPFVYLKDKFRAGPISDESEGLYFVGPLARLNQGKPAETVHAEDERQRLVASLGSLPLFSATAAYRSLVVELLQATEKMVDLYSEERLAGTEIRTLPSQLGRSGHSVFEAPEGFIYHQYEVDEHGLVESIIVLDAAAQNNALRCLLAQSIVEDSVVHGRPWDRAKIIIESGLMPF